MLGLLCHTHYEQTNASVGQETTNRWRPTPCPHWASDHELRVCTHNGVKLCHACFAQACSDWQANFQRQVAEADACPDCTRLRAAEEERIQRTQTIDPSQPYGRHIALTCQNHPDLTWTTKNIGYIGARSIFFADFRKGLTECCCPVSDLMVANRSLDND